eukprot:NODE_6406_length_509_cov_280.325991.p3 GENE.NODE_6406_length_509_cov_280.325991~~NODE_6406_length_509_cov_280.325991.p3  ORF type:complete len:69 (-),score=1.86 NODE_6406_length_509_cov_280.325991:83-289(-)
MPQSPWPARAYRYSAPSRRGGGCACRLVADAAGVGAASPVGEAGEPRRIASGRGSASASTARAGGSQN